MTKWILTAALIVSALQSIPIAQSKDTLVGSWKLISSKDMTEKGEVRDSYGRNPTGFLTYTADGRMTVTITNDGANRFPFPTGSRLQPRNGRKHLPQALHMRGVTLSPVTK